MQYTYIHEANTHAQKLNLKKKKKLPIREMMAHTFNPSDRPSLQSEFKDSQGYRGKPDLKRKENKTKQLTNKKQH